MPNARLRVTAHESVAVPPHHVNDVTMFRVRPSEIVIDGAVILTPFPSWRPKADCPAPADTVAGCREAHSLPILHAWTHRS